eukprot:TRINITY_DN19494_c0_g1::TRINITY_DN19494_c0_g1_i1::g.17152::m.17152 TRINITY_DN19494_c0_g1::TRINITY_DN19494_c0_g1_i1::g.17152  ORF type:complete len:128 (-),score=10.66,ALF/PF03752.8/17,ALF/PF03752.8/3.6 TRINITY_DN19494_c0_g1_i1:27-410(-)
MLDMKSILQLIMRALDVSNTEELHDFIMRQGIQFHSLNVIALSIQEVGLRIAAWDKLDLHLLLVCSRGSLLHEAANLGKLVQASSTAALDSSTRDEVIVFSGRGDSSRDDRPKDDQKEEEKTSSFHF